jgi:hypothetical protein
MSTDGRTWHQQRTKKRWELVEKYGLNPCMMRKISTQQLEQLDGCADDEARRLILGISERREK